MITLKCFTAQWCGPCTSQHIQLEKVKELMPEVIIEYIDVDSADGKKLSEELRLTSIPTTVVYSEGKLIKLFHGLQHKLTFIDFITTGMKELTGDNKS